MMKQIRILIVIFFGAIGILGKAQNGNYWPNTCGNPHILDSSPTFYYSLDDAGSCQNGITEFYFGAFYPDNEYVHAEFMFPLMPQSNDLEIQYATLYGPFSSPNVACAGLAGNALMSINTLPCSEPCDLDFEVGTVQEGFFIYRIGLCLTPEGNENTFSRLQVEHHKGSPCPVPCDTICDTPPCPPCPFPPCDSIPICEWYPLECDSCYYNPALCDTTSVPPCDNLITTVEELDCPTCIGSFAPLPGETYIVEGWVKEKGSDALVTNYDKGKIRLRFYDGFDSPIGGVLTNGTSGPIIEGWQRISESIDIPSDAVRMELELYVDGTSSDEVYFDDVRVSPLNSTMKSYVYDQVTMRLTEELDERNFATYYEYDEEGRLVATKKETERGIRTIQTVQQNTSINSYGN